MSCNPISPFVRLQVSASLCKQLHFVIKFVIRVYLFIFYWRGRGTISAWDNQRDQDYGEIVVLHAQIYLPIPWLVGGEHPLSCIRSPSYMLPFYKDELDRMPADHFIWQQYFDKILGDYSLVLYESMLELSHLWSYSKSSSGTNHVGMYQNVPQPCGTCLILHGIDSRAHAVTTDWSYHTHHRLLHTNDDIDMSS